MIFTGAQIVDGGIFLSTETLMTENNEAYHFALASSGDEDLSPCYLVKQPLSVLDDCTQFIAVIIGQR